MTKRPWPARIAAIAVLVAIYLVGARIGLEVRSTGMMPPLLWAPAGLGLGAVLVFGPALVIGVALGSLGAVVTSGGPALTGAVIGVVYAGEVLVAYYVLRRLDLHLALDRLRDVLALVATAVAVSYLGAFATTAWLLATEDIPARFAELCSLWWWAHLSAYVIVTPLFVTWVAGPRRRPPLRVARLVEGIALAVSVVVIGLSVFGDWLPDWWPGAHMPHYLFPVLIWAGLRFGPRGASATNTAISLLAVFGVVYHQAPFDQVADFQSFVSISAVATLALSAMHVEMARAIRRKGAIQEAALDAIVTIDAHDRIVEFNPAAERLFGISEHEALGRDVKQLFVPRELRHRAQASLADFVRGQGDALIGRRVRCPARRADGSEFPAEIAVMRMPVDGEELFTAALRDITAELQAEQARRESQQMLEQLVEQRTAELRRSEELMRDAQALAHLGSFDLDLATGKLVWSDELYRIYGRDPATFQPTYEAFLAAALPADRGAVTRAIERAVATATPFSFEERIVRPDGTLRVLQAEGKVLLDEDGKPARIVGCSQDITERKLAEAARYRLVDLVESSQDAIVSLSLDGVIETWNAAAERMFGYTAGEIVGRPGSILVPPELVPDLERRFASVRAGQRLDHYEMVQRRRDGTTFEASVTMSPILDHNKQVIGISQVLRDTTEQQRSRTLLEQSLREKEVLLREIHHRVKNNLQVISSLLNLQVASVSSEAARKALVESQTRIQSMALLHQLLYQSKDLARIDLGDYLRALVDYLVGTYAADSLRIETTLVAPHVRLDLDRSIPCGLIVNELVTNAFRHAFPDGRTGHIVVELTEQGGGRLALEVRDDGVGMPADVDLEHGHTFGLQIARLLAMQLDGDMKIRSDHHGTAVRVTFPMIARREPAPEQQGTAAASP